MEIAPFPDGARHVVYADVDADGHVRYIGKGTRTRYQDVRRSYWKRTDWRPSRRIILYQAGSDEAVRVLESVAIRQHLDAGADLLNVQRPTIPDLAAAAEARRREAQMRRRREREAAAARRRDRERRRAELEELWRIEAEREVAAARHREDERRRRSKESAEIMERLEALWARREAGLEPVAGRGLTESCFSWRNPLRKIRAAHRRLVGRRIRRQYGIGATRWGSRRGYVRPPSTSALVLAELVALARTLPGITAIVAGIVMVALIIVLSASGVV